MDSLTDFQVIHRSTFPTPMSTALNPLLTALTQPDINHTHLNGSSPNGSNQDHHTKPVLNSVDPLSATSNLIYNNIDGIAATDPTVKSDPGAVQEDGIITGSGENLNPVWPFWTRAAGQITPNEYGKLYESIGTRSKAPYLVYKDVVIDEEAKLRAVVFVPRDTTGIEGEGKRSLNKNNIKLCVKEYLIEANCKDLLPDYLSFIEGVVDCEDALQLIPRTESTLPFQSTNSMPLVKMLGQALVNISFDMFEEMNEKSFLKFYDKFSKHLKQGILDDSENFSRIFKLLRYHTSACGDERVPLLDYLVRMKEGQDHIYYDIGRNLELLGSSNLVERVTKKGFEVILMIDDPILEMSVVRKLSECESLKGKSMILVSDDRAPGQLSVDVNQAIPENIILNSADLKTYSEEPVQASADWSKDLHLLQELRRQPSRLARPKSLVDKCFIVGEPSPVPQAKKGRGAKVDDKNTVDFEGRKLTMRNFLKIPETERDVIERIENAFPDARTQELCFRVKWKYYPPNHRDKFNNEWATNVHNFIGGVAAVEKYMERIAIRRPMNSKTLKVISDWENTKSAVGKEAENVQDMNTETVQESKPPELLVSSALVLQSQSSKNTKNELVDKILPVLSPQSIFTITNDKPKVEEHSLLPQKRKHANSRSTSNKPQSIKSKRGDKSKDKKLRMSISSNRSDKSRMKMDMKLLVKSIGTNTDEPSATPKSYQSIGSQTDKPWIRTRRIHWTEEVNRADVGSPENLIIQEPVNMDMVPKRYHHMEIRPDRGRHWRRLQNYWKNKRLRLTEEDFKAFRKQQKRRHKLKQQKSALRNGIFSPEK